VMAAGLGVRVAGVALATNRFRRGGRGRGARQPAAGCLAAADDGGNNAGRGR
jgi:hypothetical protein